MKIGFAPVFSNLALAPAKSALIAGSIHNDAWNTSVRYSRPIKQDLTYSIDDDVCLGGFLGQEREVYQATSDGAYTKLLGEHGSLCWVAHESCDLEARVLK